MGYTHYFTRHHTVAPEAWEAICNDFRKLQAGAMITQPLPIQRETDDSSLPEINDTFIAFNGIGDAGHETMYVDRTAPGFNFCKTARKPYDQVVVALLCLMDFHATGAWAIRSDGDIDDWQEGLELARTVQPDAQIPDCV